MAAQGYAGSNRTLPDRIAISFNVSRGGNTALYDCRWVGHSYTGGGINCFVSVKAPESEKVKPSDGDNDSSDGYLDTSAHTAALSDGNLQSSYY